MRTRENTDKGIAVYDLNGKYRYDYYVIKSPYTPVVDISCEGKIYEILLKIPFTTDKDGHDVADIKHPIFLIVDSWCLEEYRSIKIEASDINVEKKIAMFTKSLIIAENIMNLIDRFFLGSDKTIYR